MRSSYFNNGPGAIRSVGAVFGGLDERRLLLVLAVASIAALAVLLSARSVSRAS